MTLLSTPQVWTPKAKTEELTTTVSLSTTLTEFWYADIEIDEWELLVFSRPLWTFIPKLSPQFSIFQPSTIQCWVCPGNDSKDVSACHLRTENRRIKVLAKNCSETSSMNIFLSHTGESLWVRSSWTHLSPLTLRMAEEESVASL